MFVLLALANKFFNQFIQKDTSRSVTFDFERVYIWAGSRRTLIIQKFSDIDTRAKNHDGLVRMIYCEELHAYHYFSRKLSWFHPIEVSCVAKSNDIHLYDLIRLGEFGSDQVWINLIRFRVNWVEKKVIQTQS